MLLSMAIIIFNKWILDRYPYPMILTTWHMLVGTIATQYFAHFTTIIDDRKKFKMSMSIYLKAIIPIGLCFSLSLWFGNLAYLYLSMAFIQMLKVGGTYCCVRCSFPLTRSSLGTRTCCHTSLLLECGAAQSSALVSNPSHNFCHCHRSCLDITWRYRVRGSWRPYPACSRGV